jgi:4-hydroxybenzoate polyprenyltransferase
MIGFLRLIRWPNLLIVILTQWLTRNCLVIDTSLHPYDFYLLIFSTVLIAAAGYIINDYYDVETDAINKPGKNSIGKQISRKAAFNFYWIFNVVAILLGFYLGYKLNKINLGFIHVICAGLLFFYSTTYKGMVLLGNLIIALLSAVVLLICGLFEPAVYGGYNMLIISAYTIFAFLLSLSREITKDIEDVEGDERAGYQSLPIVFGIRRAKILAISILIFTIFLLLFVQIKYIWGDILSEIYFSLAVQLPLAYLAIYTFRAKEKMAFHRAGTINKMIMLAGILSMLIFYYSL